jgi:hypothetical protein
LFPIWKREQFVEDYKKLTELEIELDEKGEEEEKKKKREEVLHLKRMYEGVGLIKDEEVTMEDRMNQE